MKTKNNTAPRTYTNGFESVAVLLVMAALFGTIYYGVQIFLNDFLPYLNFNFNFY